MFIEWQEKLSLNSPCYAGPRSAIIGHLTRKSGVLGSIPGLATYFRFSFCFSRRAVVSYWQKYEHKVLVNPLGGLSLPRKSVVRLTDRPDMTLDVYHGRKTTMQQQQQQSPCYPFLSGALIIVILVHINCNFWSILSILM